MGVVKGDKDQVKGEVFNVLDHAQNRSLSCGKDQASNVYLIYPQGSDHFSSNQIILTD